MTTTPRDAEWNRRIGVVLAYAEQTAARVACEGQADVAAVRVSTPLLTAAPVMHAALRVAWGVLAEIIETPVLLPKGPARDRAIAATDTIRDALQAVGIGPRRVKGARPQRKELDT